MNPLMTELRRRAVASPASPVFSDATRALSATDAIAAVGRVAGLLDRGPQPPRLLSRLDNCVDAILLDLAVRESTGVLIALPPYFSPAQFAHALADCGPDWLALPRGTPAPDGSWMEHLQASLPSIGLWFRKPESRPALPEATAVVTYTSGSTGQPRGVCLDQTLLLDVASALADAFAALDPRRHLCALPLSTLLESVGVYAAVLGGAEVRLQSLASLGYSGASGLDADLLYQRFAELQPHSAILVPQLLEGLVSLTEVRGLWSQPPRMLAVGGARVGLRLLERAARCGLEVYEGYGLTEAGSVLTLNRPGARRPGSVGRPLPGATVTIGADGDIQVSGRSALGYVGQAAAPAICWSTGDVGWLDDDGYLFLSGRRSHVFVTAFGRNLSPEWIETELTSEPAIAQAVVTGEAQPWNLALVVGAAGASDHDVQTAIISANARLPDYARVAAWLLADELFSPTNGLATANGRIRRLAVLQHYAERIAARQAAGPDPLLHVKPQELSA